MSDRERAARSDRLWLASFAIYPRLLYVLLAGVGAALLISALLFGRQRLSAEQWASRPMAELDALTRTDPRNPGPLLGLGIQYSRAGQTARAVAALERCLSLAPNSLEACSALAEIARLRGDNRRAAELFSRSVAIDPSFDEGYLRAANAFTQMQSYRRARPFAETYSRRQPVDWRGPFLLGMISTGEGKMSEALAHYTQAAKRAPNHAPTYLNAGATLLYGPETPDRLAAAAGWFERGLSVSAEYPELHYYLGLVRFRQRRWSDASTAFRRAVTLKPGLTEAYYPLGQSLRKLGRVTEADLCFDLYRRHRARERHG